jgi:hypothetical protein
VVPAGERVAIYDTMPMYHGKQASLAAIPKCAPPPVGAGLQVASPTGTRNLCIAPHPALFGGPCFPSEKPSPGLDLLRLSRSRNLDPLIYARYLPAMLIHVPRMEDTVALV